MPFDNVSVARRAAAWAASLSQSDLPDWDSLPPLDLYMDQVILLLRRYLSPVDSEEEEMAITASAINNYVRMKVMPPPVKKKYSRSHLACLIIICTLKPSLSIARIRRILPAGGDEAAVQALYTEFVARFRAAVAAMRQFPFVNGRPTPEGAALPLPQEGDLVITAAIFAALTKSLTEFLLDGPAAGGEAGQDAGPAKEG